MRKSVFQYGNTSKKRARDNHWEMHTSIPQHKKINKDKNNEQPMEGTQEHNATSRSEKRKGKETLLGDAEDQMAIRKADKGECKAARTRQTTTRQRLPPSTCTALRERRKSRARIVGGRRNDSTRYGSRRSHLHCLDR